jgi:hypothetical protein
MKSRNPGFIPDSGSTFHGNHIMEIRGKLAVIKSKLYNNMPDIGCENILLIWRMQEYITSF